MPHCMSASILLQTEVICVPTQWIVFDCTTTKSNCLAALIDKLGSKEVPLFSVIRLPTPEDALNTSIDETNLDEYNLKNKYLSLRPALMREFIVAYENGMKQGTKGRLVAWFVGDAQDPLSSLILRELPFDIANAFWWRHKYALGVVRLLLSPNHGSHEEIEFLKLLEPQYFSIPGFETLVRSDSLANSTASIESCTQHDAEETGSESVLTQNSSGSCKSLQKVKLMSNPYDTCILVKHVTLLEKLFDAVLPLHDAETKYVLDGHISSAIGSGGTLYHIDQGLIISASTWRRVDWLLLAQAAYLPRLLRIESDEHINNFVLLLDFRAWKGRFLRFMAGDGSGLTLSDLYEMMVEYPDSDSTFLSEDESERAGKRKRRERNWDLILRRNGSLKSQNSIDIAAKSNDIDLPDSNGSLEDIDILRELGLFDADDDDDDDGDINCESQRSNGYYGCWNMLLAEDNEYRVSYKDAFTLRELLVCLLREGEYSTCIDFIEQAKRVLEDHLPLEYLKLEGLARMRHGDNERGRKLLHRYRTEVQNNYEDAMLLKTDLSDEEQANYLNEISAIALVEGEFEVAQSGALKAIELDRNLIPAYKTLIWASTKTGTSTLAQEDLILSFFINSMTKTSKVEEYYTLCTTNHPHNPYYKYSYATFLYLVPSSTATNLLSASNALSTSKVKRDYKKAAILFKEAVELDPFEPTILQSFATFLIQTDYRDPDCKSEELRLQVIESLYRRAIEADPDHVIAQGNFAAFLLTLDDKEKVEEGRNMLDRVLYVEDLLFTHPQLSLECWFYMLCHTDNTNRAYECLQQIKAMLRLGIRSPGWNMRSHVAKAKSNSVISKEIKWIEKLAQVITAELPIRALKDWEYWVRIQSDRLVHGVLAEARSVTTNNIGNIQPVASKSQSKHLLKSFSRKRQPTNNSTAAKVAAIVAQQEKVSDTTNKQRKKTRPSINHAKKSAFVFDLDEVEDVASLRYCKNVGQNGLKTVSQQDGLRAEINLTKMPSTGFLVENLASSSVSRDILLKSNAQDEFDVKRKKRKMEDRESDERRSEGSISVSKHCPAKRLKTFSKK